jgi:hypothetical protein
LALPIVRRAKPASGARWAGGTRTRTTGFRTYETSTSRAAGGAAQLRHRLGRALPRRWEARGWVQREWVEQGDSFGIFNDFTDTGTGLGLRAFVTDALFVEARGAWLEREDNFGFATPETVYSLQLGWEF